MPRIIQPNQVITYRKKITYKNPDNGKKSFWEEFFKTLAVQILAVGLGIFTGGIGTALVSPLGFSNLGIALTSFFVQSSVNFTVNQIYDTATGNKSDLNTLLNVIFSLTDIGQFGRALKYDKLLKLSNQSNIFKKIGIKNNLNNFYQLKQNLLFKDIVVGKTKFAFKNKITDVEILNLIANLVTPQTKKAFKLMTTTEINLYLNMQKTLHKINPKLIEFVKPNEIKYYDKLLKKYQDIGINDFFKMNDLQAVNFLADLGQTNFGIGKILKLNNARIQSKFQEEFFQMFKRYKKLIKTKLDKINPIKMTKKIVDKILKPATDVLKNLKSKTYKLVSKFTKIQKNVLKKLNLIPCHFESFLLGFKFEPMTADGSGYCTIYKKPYVSKKTGRISNYNYVRVWSNLIEVEKFAMLASGDEQSIYYNENWALGHGFKKSIDKNIKLLGLNLTKIQKKLSVHFNKIASFQSFFKAGILTSSKRKAKQTYSKILNNTTNKMLSKTINIIPFSNIFTSAIIKKIKGKKVRNNDIYNPINKKISKKLRRIKIYHV